MDQQPSSAPTLRVPGEVAPDRSKEAGKKKKNWKDRVTNFFTKRRKKKGQPSLAEAEGEPESSPQPLAQVPTGR